MSKILGADWLTIDELCRLWSVKKSWIYNQIYLHNLPRKRLAGRVRFEPAELNKWLSGRSGGKSPKSCGIK